MKKLLLTLLLFVLLTPNIVYAHPGRTNNDGGHTDNSTGEYHYHHGYSAHRHENGECPYETSDKTDDNEQNISIPYDTSSDTVDKLTAEELQERYEKRQELLNSNSSTNNKKMANSETNNWLDNDSVQKTINGIFSVLLLVFLYFLFHACLSIYENHKAYLLYKNVAAIMTNKVHHNSLFYNLAYVTSKLDNSYLIKHNEHRYIYRILECFRDELSSSYFNASLTDKINILSLCEIDFFFYYLYLYLCKHESSTLRDHDIIHEMTKHSDYDTALKIRSDFETAYIKMQLIAAYYCKENKNLKEMLPSCENQYENVKEYFDKTFLNRKSETEKSDIKVCLEVKLNDIQ